MENKKRIDKLCYLHDQHLRFSDFYSSKGDQKRANTSLILAFNIKKKLFKFKSELNALYPGRKWKFTERIFQDMENKKKIEQLSVKIVQHESTAAYYDSNGDHNKAYRYDNLAFNAKAKLFKLKPELDALYPGHKWEFTERIFQDSYGK